jgi:hypothetical protein
MSTAGSQAARPEQTSPDQPKHGVPRSIAEDATGGDQSLQSRKGRGAAESGQSGTQSASSGGTGFADPAPTAGLAQTDEERTADLDRKLDASLATFDGKLRRENKLLEGSSLERGTEAVVGSSPGVPGKDATGGRAASGSGDGYSPDIPLEQQADVRQVKRPGAAPADIPDPHDDDIVARQLREAAENETDPALREKLWEEYRKYKSDSGT